MLMQPTSRSREQSCGGVSPTFRHHRRAEGTWLILFMFWVVVFSLRQNLGWKHSEVAPQLRAHPGPSIPCSACPAALCLDHRWIQAHGEESRHQQQRSQLPLCWCPMAPRLVHRKTQRLPVTYAPSSAFKQVFWTVLPGHPCL